MKDIKFGTDGWRAIIARDFTTDNVARVAQATSQWLLKREKEPSIVLGHDCRFAGRLFAETAASVFISHGIRVHMATGFVSTPMISYGTLIHKASLGIIITASHNPPSYNGYKIKASFGGPLPPELVQEIEDIIPASADKKWMDVNLKDAAAKGMLRTVNLEDEYISHVRKNFDLDAIHNAKLGLAYDAMYGAGQRVIERLFPEITRIHSDENPGFHGQAPEPIHKNLQPFSDLIRRSKGKILCGLATDGDADRIGLYDQNGKFVDSHHIILLLIHYLVKYKKMKGKVVVAFSVSNRIRKMCEHYGLELQVVKIGFKHVCSIMVNEDVLLGGEESGGIAIKGHIPERDGIWMGLTIWEFMARTGKSLDALISEIYGITGPFHFDRNDLHIDESLKQDVLKKCAAGQYTSFGKYKVTRVEDLDGYKYFFDDDTWMMIRASGTEPVLRVYAEASDEKTVNDILSEAGKVLTGPRP